MRVKKQSRESLVEGIYKEINKDKDSIKNYTLMKIQKISDNSLYGDTLIDTDSIKFKELNIKDHKKYIHNMLILQNKKHRFYYVDDKQSLDPKSLKELDEIYSDIQNDKDIKLTPRLPEKKTKTIKKNANKNLKEYPSLLSFKAEKIIKQDDLKKICKILNNSAYNILTKSGKLHKDVAHTETWGLFYLEKYSNKEYFIKKNNNQNLTLVMFSYLYPCLLCQANMKHYVNDNNNVDKIIFFSIKNGEDIAIKIECENGYCFEFNKK